MKEETEIIKRVNNKTTGEPTGDAKKIAFAAFFESLITILLGVLLIAWPDVIVKIIAYVVGAFFAIKGCYKIINYFMTNGYNNFFNNDLLNGVISILAGVVIFAIGEEVSRVFRIVIGIWIIYEALSKMNIAIKLSFAKIASWRFMLILAIMMLVLGVFVTFCENAAIILMGWFLFISGVMGICTDIMLMQNVDKTTNNV